MSDPDGRKPVILVVDDDEDMARLNARILKREGYDTLVAYSFKAAKELAMKKSPDLFVFDVVLPDGDGFALCEELQQITDAPVLFVTGKTETKYKIAGLDAGGDYYLTKPYDKNEFVAVVQRLLRRARRTREMLAGTSVITRGSLTLKIDERKAYINDRDAGLSPKEFALLLLLVQNEDKEMSSDKLYESVWNAPMLNNSGAIRVHISNLKKKLDEENASDFVIFSEHGKGYTFSTM